MEIVAWCNRPVCVNILVVVCVCDFVCSVTGSVIFWPCPWQLFLCSAVKFASFVQNRVCPEEILFNEKLLKTKKTDSKSLLLSSN